MRTKTKTTTKTKTKTDLSEPAQYIRAILDRAGLSQREAARQLEINERTMRRYVAGAPMPRRTLYALLWIASRHTHESR